MLRLLTVYTISSLAKAEPQLEDVVERERLDLRGRYTLERWRRIAAGRHTQMILLTPIIEEARNWLLADAPAPSETAEASGGAPRNARNDALKPLRGRILPVDGALCRRWGSNPHGHRG